MSDSVKQISSPCIQTSLDRAALRYAFGSVGIMSIAMAYAWNLSFLTPILALSFLAPNSTVPSFKQGLSFILLIATTTFLGFIFSKYFLDKELVFIPILALVLFYTYYTNKLKTPVKTFMLISFLLLPVLSMQHIAIAYSFNIYFIIGATLTIIFVRIVYFLIPDKTEADAGNKQQASQTKEIDDTQLTNAIQAFIVVFPVVLFFFYFNWNDALIILMFIGILSMNSTFNAKAGFALLVGNLLGGLMAIIAYELLVMVPHFIFFILLILGVALLLSTKIFSTQKTAPLYGMAYSTFLLILGQSTTSTSNAGQKVWMRVIMIMAAVLYVVIALKVIEAYKERRSSKIQAKTSKLKTN